MASVAARAPSEDGLNEVVTVQSDAAGSAPPSAHVVTHGNSATFESVTEPTATGDVPVFQSVATIVELDVVPTAVEGNVGPVHVIVNVDGWVVVGVGVVVVSDVSLEHADATTSATISGMYPRRTGGVHCIAKAPCAL